jgi:arabinose-5-phosphate isomerase
MYQKSICTFKDVLLEEGKAIRQTSEAMDDTSLEKAIALLDQCNGKFVLIGVGKSGIIAKKVAATLNSIGCVSIYLHPSEALHGDFGIATQKDVAIILSNSGETDEILRILPYLKHREVPIIAIVGNGGSTLAKNASASLVCRIEKEADPYNLVPTTSAIVALSIGDAIAMVLMELKKVTPDKYALNHPAGSLGKRLTLRISDFMFSDDDNPKVKPEGSWIDVINAMNKKSLGGVNVVDKEGYLKGIITDGDIRRLLKKTEPSRLALLKSRDMMTSNPVVVTDSILAYDALNMLRSLKKRISVIPVVDKDNRCIGMVRIADIHAELGV